MFRDRDEGLAHIWDNALLYACLGADTHFLYACLGADTHLRLSSLICMFRGWGQGLQHI